jgi:hypothetical protein
MVAELLFALSFLVFMHDFMSPVFLLKGRNCRRHCTYHGVTSYALDPARVAEASSMSSCDKLLDICRMNIQ